MVRRWSYINFFNFHENKNSFHFFKKTFKINVFKKSVSLKRFTKKYTKFKRKAFNRLRHQSNWMIYHNVFKFWSKDFLFVKNYSRYQYFDGIFINNFIFFNCNFFKNKNINIYCNWNFYFFNFPKTTLNYFYFFKNAPLNVKNSPISKAFFLNEIKTDDLAFPAYSEWDHVFYPFYLKNKKFDFDFTFKILNFFLIKNLLEYYKLLVLFYFFLIKNF